jgi:putative flippase GtrA
VRPPDRAGLKRVATFLAIGGSAFVLDVLVVGGLKALGVDPLLGRIVSLSLGLVYTWWLNRNLTFATTEAPSLREFATFAGANAAGLAINWLVYAGALHLGAPLIVAMLVGTVVASIWNFLAYQRILKR